MPLKIIHPALIGSKEVPLRPSQLFRLLECPMQALVSISDEARASGMAADTGSMVHGFAKAFHECKDESIVKRQQEAVKGIAELKVNFPFADEEKAIGIFSRYSEDPRNFMADVVVNELPIEFQLEPWIDDPTGELIYIQGTCDQIRKKDGNLFLWDIKTGRQTAWSLIHQATIQVAAYYLGAVKQYPNLKIGGLIRTVGYDGKAISPDGVFCPMPFVESDAIGIMDGVRMGVSRMRQKQVHIAPGLHCNYCPAYGVTSCKPKLDSLKREWASL